MQKVKIFYLFILSAFTTIAAYQIPKVRLEVLEQSYRVSIPDKPGIRTVAFNINRNRPFQAFEQGEISVQLREPTNNLWVHEVKSNLEDNDIVYIWTNVQHNSLSYRSVAEQIEVKAHKTTDDSQERNDLTTATATAAPNVGNVLLQETNNKDTSNVAVNCEPTITVVTNQNVCAGQLIFEENFNADLDTNRWTSEIRLPLDIGDAEFVLYNDSAVVANGLLNIEPVLWNDDKPGTNIKRGMLDLGASCTGNQDRTEECRRQADQLGNYVMPPVITARINTKNSFNFKYGRIDIRAKLPQGDWLFPLLLLEPTTKHYGQNAYASGQIRVAYARGNPNLVNQHGQQIDGRTLYGGAVLTLNSDSREKSMVKKRSSSHFGEKFHIYSLNWSDKMLTLKVDGQEYGSVDGGFLNDYPADISNAWKAGDYMAPFDQQFFITLGLSAGGHVDFPENSTSNNRPKPWMNSAPKAAYTFWRDRSFWKSTWTSPALQVDYVRVYAI